MSSFYEVHVLKHQVTEDKQEMDARKAQVSRRFSPYCSKETEEEKNDKCKNTNRRSLSCHKKIGPLWTAIICEDARTDKSCTDNLKRENKCSPNLPAAMYDQGNHEVEVVAEGFEASLRWRSCEKNVGHTNFIQPSQLSLHHLPELHRDDHIFKYIKLWSQLVVKVTVSNISMDRPEGFPFYTIRGHHLPITGSGKVTDITTVDNSPCPCQECVLSDNPKMMWKAVWIMTAMHVLFDDTEAAQSHVELFYDSPNSKDGVRKLKGIRVVDLNKKGDWCKFECATHDLDLGTELERIDAQVVELGRLIMDRKFQPLAVIASHPHGCSKFITVGEWKDRRLVKDTEENYEWTEYSYTTSTCTGCSGAPVWILGPDRTHYSYNYYSHVHSEGLKCGLNKSGAGDIEKRWDES